MVGANRLGSLRSPAQKMKFGPDQKVELKKSFVLYRQITYTSYNKTTCLE
jgi:hypothetical protein